MCWASRREEDVIEHAMDVVEMEGSFDLNGEHRMTTW